MGVKHSHSGPNELEGIRLDIWLWRARFFKSRTLSATTVKRGRIRLTRFGTTQKIKKPHFPVLPHDKLVFMRGDILEKIEVVKLGTRRGPAKEAQSLYTPLSDTHE